jgi:hypothetical protein
VTEPTYGDIVPILAPLMDALDGLATAADTLAGFGIPMADSPAMAEIAQESAIGGDGFEEPVHSAHSNAGILRFAATDYLRTFVRMFRSKCVPVYGHIPVARACLESAAQSYWAITRDIGPTARVQRYQLIRLRNALAMGGSPIPELKAQGSLVRAKIQQQCDERGWKMTANGRKLEVGGEQLPGSGALIRTLLAHNSEAPGLDHLGATAWWLWSGVSHAVNYALLESVDGDGTQSSSLAPNVVPISTSSQTVQFQGLILGHAFLPLIEEHRTVFGWSDDAWGQAAVAFVAETRRILATSGLS